MLRLLRYKASESGTIHDRDINAAVNILNKGFESLSVESIDYRRGETVSHCSSGAGFCEASIKQ